MKNIIIIIGHAHYATGLLSALEMIAGKYDDIMAINFEGDENVAPKYEEVIKQHPKDNILFVCDLMGGTPYKEAAKLAFSKPNIEVVSGCNLGSLLEMILTKDKLNLKDLVANIVSSSKKNASILDKEALTKRMDEEHEGI